MKMENNNPILPIGSVVINQLRSNHVMSICLAELKKCF